jgi:hypothetical protein
MWKFEAKAPKPVGVLGVLPGGAKTSGCGWDFNMTRREHGAASSVKRNVYLVQRDAMELDYFRFWPD